MCDSNDHMKEGCGCSKDAASGKMEEGKHAMKEAYEKGKEGMKDMADGMGDKAKNMMHSDNNS